jgi:uncharacterized damage-inducible protein DinB
MTDPRPTFRYGGARALVALHEEQLRAFLATWRRAQAAQVTLPETADAAYASREHVLHHVLRAARSYMVWICENLELSDPGIAPPPELADVEAHADAYVEHLITRWRPPLTDVAPQRFGEVYPSRWGTPTSIDAMLEHAVMHPLRHRHQLENLLREQGAG